MKAIDLIAAVRKLASDYPDAIYDEGLCLYTQGGCGPGSGCIIGQAMIGVDPSKREQLASWDENDEEDVRGVIMALELDFDAEDINWLAAAQRGQDIGNPWAEAIIEADVMGIEGEN